MFLTSGGIRLEVYTASERRTLQYKRSPLLKSHDLHFHQLSLPTLRVQIIYTYTKTKQTNKLHGLSP
jgi:hypothetical protein